MEEFTSKQDVLMFKNILILLILNYITMGKGWCHAHLDPGLSDAGGQFADDGVLGSYVAMEPLVEFH